MEALIFMIIQESEIEDDCYIYEVNLEKDLGQLLYHDVISTYMHHFVQDDPHPLKDVIQVIITTSSSLPKRCTIGPLAQLNSMVSSCFKNGKATTAGSLLVFEDNVGED